MRIRRLNAKRGYNARRDGILANGKGYFKRLKIVQPFSSTVKKTKERI